MRWARRPSNGSCMPSSDTAPRSGTAPDPRTGARPFRRSSESRANRMYGSPVRRRPATLRVMLRDAPRRSQALSFPPTTQASPSRWIADLAGAAKAARPWRGSRQRGRPERTPAGNDAHYVHHAAPASRAQGPWVPRARARRRYHHAMKPNRLLQLWSEGRVAANAWLGLADGFAAEIVALGGFDSVVFDLQHGMAASADLPRLLQAVSSSAAVPLVRVPTNEPAMIMRALDAGAIGVIVPMVETAEQAAAAVSAA